jgi:hypothetical protein
MISLLCSSAESYLRINAAESPGLGLTGILSLEQLRQSILSLDLLNPPRPFPFIALLDSPDLSFDDQTAFAIFVGCSAVCFTLTQSNHLAIVSSVLSQVHNHPTVKFIAFCDNLSLWTSFSILCNAPSNLQVCPRISATYPLWFSANLHGISIFESDFNICEDSVSFLQAVECFYCFFARMRLQTVIPAAVFQSDGHRDCLFQVLAAPKNRIGLAPRPIMAQFEEAIRIALEARPGSTVGIVADPFGHALDSAIRAGARRIALLGHSQAASEFLRVKAAAECSKLENLVISIGDESIDVLVSPSLDLAAPDRIERYRKLLPLNGVILPSRFSIWLALISNERLWSQANAESTFQKMTERRLEGSFVLSERIECFRFDSSGAIGNHREVQFTVQADWFADGLGCWFEAASPPHIRVSCRPREGEKQLFLAFPARKRCRKGEVVTVSIARGSDGGSVWLEWAAWTERAVIPIQNPRGAASRFPSH